MLLSNWLNMLFFSYHGTDVYGISYQASICNRHPENRVIILNWLKSHRFSAYILAHEIGHSLGLEHDFIQPECNNIGGIMDYNDFYLKRIWTKCSIRDFRRFQEKLLYVCLEKWLNPAPTNPTCVQIAPKCSTGKFLSRDWMHGCRI